LEVSKVARPKALGQQLAGNWLAQMLEPSNWLATGWHKCLGPRTGWQLAGNWLVPMATKQLHTAATPTGWLAGN